MFIRVPKAILKYSLEYNKLILPVYLYSAVNANMLNNYIVDTNIYHIVETFNPNADSRKGYNRKYLDTIAELHNGREGVFGGMISVKGEVGKLEKSNRLQYYFLGRELKIDNKFVSVDSNEYFYILNKVEENNVELNFNEMKPNEMKVNKKGIKQSNIRNSLGTKTLKNEDKHSKVTYNIVDLLNLYVYLKNQIEFYNYLSQEQDKDIAMHESMDSIAKKLKVGPKTVAKYIHQLENMKMIKIVEANYKNKKANEYYLNNEWMNEINNSCENIENAEVNEIEV